MNAQIELIEGTNRNHAQSQFFTPPKLAAKLVEWAGVTQCEPCAYSMPNHGTHSCGMRVLEPSAGNGALVRPLLAAGAEVMAIELDKRYEPELYAMEPTWALVADFLSLTALAADGSHFDLCVGNFPFHLDLTGEFTLHALKFAPRVCAIYPSNVFYSEQREDLWKQVRPTRIAFMSKRAWPGATDYVALELERRTCRPVADLAVVPQSVEWWHEAWY